MDARIALWLKRDPDEEMRAELRSLVAAGDDAELAARFSGRLRFGTAGLRGVVGAGPTRMNRLVVIETTLGLAAYLGRQVENAPARGVVVGYDGRTDSRRFAEDAAASLAASGFMVHLFDRVVATPICAYAVAKLGAAAGIVVTASHNPPEYNGYKVYWENGAQIIPPHDAGIADEIESASKRALPLRDLEAARAEGWIHTLGEETVEAYFEAVRSRSIHPGGAHRAALELAYTPLHGVGAAYVEALLPSAGFTSLHTVPSQREPDGTFPTVAFPNPEEPGAMDAVMALAAEHNAPLALANDPDADRLAVAARKPDGSYDMLSGNQVGALLGADRISGVKAGELACVGTTLVSSRMLSKIAAAAGVGYFETLTGFKWIANVALSRAAEGERFVMGYEEALGYMVGDLVRDKDGLSAMLAFVEMAAQLAERGETVWDALEALYRKHGLHLSALRSRRLEPGARAGALTDALRAAQPSSLAGRNVVSVADLSTGEKRRADGSEEAVSFPTSDVLVYELEGGARVVVRPSGTEPKVKCYYELCSPIGADEAFEVAEARVQAELDALVETHQAELNTLG